MDSSILNRMFAIENVLSAYGKYCDDVVDKDAFRSTAEMIIKAITRLDSEREFCNLFDPENEINLGELKLIEYDNPERMQLLHESIPASVREMLDNVCLTVQKEKSVTILVEVDDDDGSGLAYAQDIFIEYLSKKPHLSFRCIDTLGKGYSFPNLHELVTKQRKISGGQIISKKDQVVSLLSFLEREATSVIAKVVNTGMSLCEYNATMETKLPEYITLIYADSESIDSKTIEGFRILSANRRSNGISSIIIGNADVLSAFSEEADFYFYASKGEVCLRDKEMLKIKPCFGSLNERIKTIIQTINDNSRIDTRIEKHSEINSEFLKMDSIESLRIPFAIDEYNHVKYFEIGGHAPTHALISGSTGSGKSVALHTMIMQIITNYHPDDVEIWAIDYKAVEFGQYTIKRTPHFKVIAQDDSVEFSLSLLDLLNDEYNRRKQLFVQAGVKNIEGYRKRFGQRSMPRIIVFIDEFQLLTQAVQTYSGNKDYRTMLENLFRLTRAMGISFVLSSQTIASGLAGLTDSARDQIGARLSLKHDDQAEIQETLMIRGEEAGAYIEMVRNLPRGGGVYKRPLLPGEVSLSGKQYELANVNILYINDELKDHYIDSINEMIGADYTPKDEIIVKGNGRISVSEKERHPISKYVNGDYDDTYELKWYPAAPTTLADSFSVTLDETSGDNILFIGDDKELKKSVIMHSILGFLTNQDCKVYFNAIGPNNAEKAGILAMIKSIDSGRLIVNDCISNILNTIKSVKTIKPQDGECSIYVWYGLDKLKNEIFLLNQEEEEHLERKDSKLVSIEKPNESADELLAQLMGLLGNENKQGENSNDAASNEILSYEEYSRILNRLFDAGPENGYYNLVVFPNVKSMKRSRIIPQECFEHRIGSKMSADDSFEFYGTSMATNAANDTTVLYYPGMGKPIPLRPYLLPSDEWVKSFNKSLVMNEN